ncbi:gamma-tubulin complex component protein [Coniochaeta sp. 2T2.1]|nr:gamma-tubulin complex component protein [Coniochaeta sp. 2T2.1]
MLHEILLSLSGHPSPLLREAAAAAAAADSNNAHVPISSAGKALSPPERALLASLAHISDLHIKLMSATAQISASHRSTICRAVATAVDTVHLAAFRRKVLDVEDAVLHRDAALVGAYNIVPLTAVVSEFTPWTRRLEWLWEIVQFMQEKDGGAGPSLIDRLTRELQTGYADIEETSKSLVRVAEVAWLKQVSAWILYGQLPSFGADDFFVQRSEDGEETFICVSNLLPSFVTPSTAASMLFIGQSLNRIRSRSLGGSQLQGAGHLSSQLKELSKLTYPLDPGTFSATIANIRHFLSRTTLQKLLPFSKVMEILQLLRDFFLLGRGEFAMALIQQADEKIRSRWRRAENLAYEKRDGLSTVVLKEGEASAVLARTWAALGSMLGQHAEEDEGVELARDLLRLTLSKSSKQNTPAAGTEEVLSSISSTPFRNILFSVPVIMTLQIPAPLDLFLSQSDLQTYTAVNSYLMSIRRAHIRLTDLWKITSLRRHHPPPPAPPFGTTPAGKEKTRLLRGRHIARENALRSTWATCSAAIFFLAETEAYLQTEVVAGLWEGFQRWLTTGSNDEPPQQRIDSQTSVDATVEGNPDDEDIWLEDASTTSQNPDSTTTSHQQTQDPQSLAQAHRSYLRYLVHRLLLTNQPFTEALYELLVHVDRLVALVTRLQAVWTAADLETDVGVVDAFVDHEREEREVVREVRDVERKIKEGVAGCVGVLRGFEGDWGNIGLEESEGNEDVAGAEMRLREEGMYVPRRVGGVDRLLMKLDFGSWFDGGSREDDLEDGL